MMSPSYLWCLATELAGAVNAVLAPFMAEMREGLAAVKTDLRKNSDLELRILENVTRELARVADSESQLESVNAGIRSELARMSQFIVERSSQLVLDSQELVIHKLDRVGNGLSELVSGIEAELGNLSRSVDVCVAGVGESKVMTDRENCTGQDVGSGSGTSDAGGYECGGTFGWRRVVYLDMTDPTTNCPSGWRFVIHDSKRLCGRVSSSSYLSCDSAIFPVTGGYYSSVCGSIRAYQRNKPDAFEPYHTGVATTIEGGYASGVSLTHGSPRQHIWTFAAGAKESAPESKKSCPCDATISIRIPPFVGEDYFCESGVNSGSTSGFHPNDPLWDGSGCTTSSRCCSFNNPPYFTKQLPNPTSDDIEARLCGLGVKEDTPIEFMELYVK